MRTVRARFFEMLSIRKMSGAAFGMIHFVVIAAICGWSTNATAQDDVSEKAFRGSDQLRKREERAAQDIDKYVTQLDRTARAIKRLGRADGDDLRKRYKAFSEEVERLEEAQKRAVSSVDKMKAAGVEYFSSWEKANGSISDPELREEAARRHSTMMRKHIDLAQAIGDIGIEIQPFMSRLQDLRAFLGADLSQRTVRMAGERIQECQSDAQALRSNIGEVQATLKRFLSETPR
jgi:uncharacterized protein YoxC